MREVSAVVIIAAALPDQITEFEGEFHMSISRLICSLFAIALSGCVTVAELDKALEKPVAKAKSAASIAQDAGKDIVKAYALGQFQGVKVELAELTCVPQLGPRLASQNLTAFVDSLTALHKVAEKPADASYAGYIKKFQENAKAIARKPEEEKAEAEKEIEAAQTRCTALAKADDLPTADDRANGKPVPPESNLQLPMPVAGAGFLPGLPAFLALDQLLRSVLSAFETAQRNAAIIATASNILPQLKEAVTNLRAQPNPTFGPRVVYKDSTSIAASMEKTYLGATITIHRWMVARKIRMLWETTQSCRSKGNCMSSRDMHKAADELVENIYEYRTLSGVNTDKILDLLDKGIADAEAASKNKTLGGVIDAIIAIGDTLSGINKKYDDYRKTRD